MLTYCYICDSTNHRLERQFEPGTAPVLLHENGVIYHRDLQAEQCSGKRSRSGNIWRSKPIYSRSVAVHPRQIPRAVEYCKQMGVPTEFDPMGHPIFTSRAHRRKHCQARGWVDYDGGYSDP